MPDRLATANIDIDPELIPGARNAVSVCLQLRPEERVTIITDEATHDIAAALRAEVERIRSEYSIFILENYASRPLTAMPQNILDDLAQSDVSIFCAQSQRGELTSRITFATRIWSTFPARSCGKVCAPITAKWMHSASA
jgi:hypothetical protein